MKFIFPLALLIVVCQAVCGQSAQDYLDEGYEYYQSGEYDKAIESYKKSIDSDSSNAEVFYLLGVSQSQSGNNKDALTSYNNAITLNSDYAEAYFEKGYSYMMLKDYKHAIAAFDKCLEINPNYVEALVNRGSTYFITGDEAKGKADWLQAKAMGASIPALDE